MNRHQKIGLCSFLVAVMQTAWAAKIELPCDDSKSPVVKASTHGFTRISVKGDRLRDVMGLEEDVIVEKNDAEGILFLKNIKNKQTITLITENGVFQDVTLVPDGSESMNIVFKPEVQTKSVENEKNAVPNTLFDPHAMHGSFSMNTQETLIQFIKHLFSGIGDATKDEHVRTSPSGLDAVSTRIVHVQGMVGEVFTITNTENQTTILLEKDFYQRGDLAIALQKKQIQAGESTSLFVIRSL